MPRQFWHIHRCSLLEQLDDEQLGRLERTARVREFSRGQVVYLPSDAANSVFFLSKGRVRLSSTTPEGKLAILGFIEPGEVFGELALIDSGLREERAEALVQSTIVMLSGESLEQLMEQSAGLTLKVTKLMGLRRRQVERRLRSLLFRSNKTRLVILLLELLDQYGLLDQYRDPTHQARLINPAKLEGIRISHQDLASLIGATRESVTHLLGDLQLRGIVQCGRQMVIVRDLKRLKSEADAETRLTDSQKKTDPRESSRKHLPT